MRAVVKFAIATYLPLTSALQTTIYVAILWSFCSVITTRIWRRAAQRFAYYFLHTGRGVTKMANVLLAQASTPVSSCCDRPGTWHHRSGRGDC